ncbi:MAG: hypothetical protein GY700_06330 [Propionibacteriaceae bacterium]|nr:hypothetical protein [Propionibacteriaceae bacterium]
MTDDCIEIVGVATDFNGTVLNLKTDDAGSNFLTCNDGTNDVLAISQAGVLRLAEGTSIAGSSSGSSGIDNLIDFQGTDTGDTTHGYNVVNIEWTGDTGSGTSNGLRVNAPSGFTGDLVKADVNAAEKFAVDHSGNLAAGGNVSAGGELSAEGRIIYRTYMQANLSSANYGYLWPIADDGLHLAVRPTDGVANNNLIITTTDAVADDYDHSTASANPTIIIQSATAAASATDQWLSATHDQTDGVIDVGTGDIKLDDDVTITGDLHATRHFFNENFLWTSGIYGTVWDLTNVNGLGTNAMKAGAGMGGVTLLTTGAAGAGDYESTWTRDDYFSRVIQPTVDAHVTLDTDLAGKQVYFGLSDTPMGAGTDYVFFLFDYSNDNVNWWHSSGGGTDASLSVGPTAGTEQHLRIHLTSAGVATFYVDDSLAATVTGAVANDHGDMYLFYGVWTEAAQAEIIEVDHIYAQWD